MFGLISKKKVAREIAKIYNEHNEKRATEKMVFFDHGAQSSLNQLCDRLDITPMHNTKLNGETSWSKVKLRNLKGE